MNIKLIAEVYRLGLLIDYFKVEEVIRWVDKIIDTTDAKDIPYIFFDLSLSKDKKHISRLLKSIEGSIDEKDLPTKIMLGILFKGWESKEQAKTIRMAGNLVSISFMTMENDELFGIVVALIDQYEEALNGYGDPSCSESIKQAYVREAVQEIRVYFQTFEGYAEIWTTP